MILERRRERERDVNQLPLVHAPTADFSYVVPPGTEPTTLQFTGQQTSEPHQPGPVLGDSDTGSV